MPKLVKTDVPGFEKDLKTGLVINTGGNFEQFELRRKQSKRIVSTQDDLNNTKKELAEIKTLLKKLLESK